MAIWIFHNWPVPPPPYDSSLTPFLGHLNFSFFKIEELQGVWEYAWLRACMKTRKRKREHEKVTLIYTNYDRVIGIS